MDLERFYQLLSRKMAGQASESELQELFTLMEENEELFSLYSALTTPTPFAGEAIKEEAESSFAVHAVKMQMHQEVSEEETALPVLHQQKPAATWMRKTVLLAAAAASLLLFLVGGQYFLYQPEKSTTTGMAPNEVVTKKGSRSTILLPDGTRVSLNANSKLTYKENFGTDNREVILSGEAFFDVKRDSRRPFIIHTEKMNIKVLGTSFNVKNYPEDDLVEAALIHGKIEVTFLDRPAEKMFLKPGDKLVLRKNQEEESHKTSVNGLPKIQLTSISPLEDSTLVETAWMDNKIAFSNASLKEIAAQLERRFDVEIEFADSTLLDYTYTGIFEKETPERILQLLSFSQRFNYVTKTNKIVIMK